MVRQFNETFSGWGAQTCNGGIAGLEGYTHERAEQVAEDVRKNMQATRGILEVIVKVEPMGNGNYRVVNTSKYESSL